MPDSLGRSNDQRRQETLQILDAASSIRAPGRSPKPRSRQLAGPGCAAALRILDAASSIRTPGGSPKPRSRQLAGPGCAAALRILAAGCMIRTPGGSGAGGSPVLDALQPSGSSLPAARSEAPGGSPEPRSGQLDGFEMLIFLSFISEEYITYFPKMQVT